MSRSPFVVAACLFPLLLLTACGSPTAAKKAPHHPKKVAAKTTPPATIGRPKAGNELGEIPVFEYHTIGSTPGRWQTTPQMLTADLTWLYDHNFRLITMKDLETGNIDIPAGTHAAVLTFDDGSVSQFQWNAQHVPTPTSSVGVLEAFQTSHPKWPVTATFYLNKFPWGSDSTAKMQWMVAHGFELGNHTYDHANLNLLDPAGIEKEVGEEEAYIEQAVPGYVPVSFALPYGSLPANAADRQAVLQGTYEGTTWHFDGAVLVGANPSPSPFSKNWNIEVPRVQEVDPSLVSAGTLPFIMAGVEQRFETDPAAFYTSGGNPNYIPFPASEASLLNPAYSAKADPIPPSTGPASGN